MRSVDTDWDTEAGRVADRLNVLGRRWSQREHAADVAALAGVRSALQQLADLTADAAGEPRREVPELAGHALADQVWVLAHDAASAGAGPAARDVLATLRRSL